MSDTPETDKVAMPVIGFYSCATVPADFARMLERERDSLLDQRDLSLRMAKERERERDEAREALADIALMDTSGLAAPAVCRALRSLGQWKDILDAKTTQYLRLNMEDTK